MQAGDESERVAGLARSLIRDCELDLSGLTVYTEAATGEYRVTAGLAATAGARRVFAVARNSRHGTMAEAHRQTSEFATSLGVAYTVEPTVDKLAAQVGGSDIITNSGHVRPIDAEMIGWMPDTAVIPLMYEGWEVRHADVDLAACRRRGISVAGTNETHPVTGILHHSGVMAQRLLHELGVHAGRIAVWSNNPFAVHISTGLADLSYEVVVMSNDAARRMSPENGGITPGPDYDDIPRVLDGIAACDALVAAFLPSEGRVIGSGGLVSTKEYRSRCGNVPVAQFWALIDRPAADVAGVRIAPSVPPADGHMGVLPSAAGLEAVIRIQLGGLKTGEVMARARLGGATEHEAVELAVRSGYGTYLPEVPAL